MYPAELEIKDTTKSYISASYLDPLMSIEMEGHLRTCLKAASHLRELPKIGLAMTNEQQFLKNSFWIVIDSKS